MNQANTVCLIAILILMGTLANVLCFGTNPNNLGGYGPAMLMVLLPLLAFALGTIRE